MPGTINLSGSDIGVICLIISVLTGAAGVLAGVLIGTTGQ
jgi:hypothetical protein